MNFKPKKIITMDNWVTSKPDKKRRRTNPGLKPSDCSIESDEIYNVLDDSNTDDEAEGSENNAPDMQSTTKEIPLIVVHSYVKNYQETSNKIKKSEV